MSGALRVAVAVALVLTPIVSAVGLRVSGHALHSSLVRMGPPTRAAALIMGARDEASQTDLQQMQAMDQYWFAFEDIDADKLQRIALDMASGDQRLGARTVACMSDRAGVGLEQAREAEVRVCAGGAEDDLGVLRCEPADWQDQGGRLVLLSVVGQHARLDRTKLIRSCQVNARHWREWHQRQ